MLHIPHENKVVIRILVTSSETNIFNYNVRPNQPAIDCAVSSERIK